MKISTIITSLLLSFSCALSQQKITGIILDAETKLPLPGTTLSMTDKSVVAVADSIGKFFLKSETEFPITLQVRHLGYETAEVKFSSAEEVVEILLLPSTTLAETVLVTSTRASEKSPVTFFSLEKSVIQKQNFGQDMPYLLNLTPSVVTTSDAGTGIGYTGIRVRGSDATRINVTINGVPYNDSESQGVFWVDVPDIASSAQSIQIQRGVGTSGNGAGAFGATINLQTNTLSNKPYGELIQSAGTFNTLRTTVGAGTGKLKNNLAIDFRASSIVSDGFIDRAHADLKSYYGSAGYYGKKSIVKLIAFGGNERTYQSWYGVPESRLKNDVVAMQETALTEGWSDLQLNHLLTSGSRTFNFYTYPNQVDDYSQHHVQLHGSNRITASITGNLSLHFTKGKGYYEEERLQDAIVNYGKTSDSGGILIPEFIDLVRRRWLSNNFYGGLWSLDYLKDSFNSNFGGSWNIYDGDHFGEIIRANNPDPSRLTGRYYFNNGLKKDLSVYWKNGLTLKGGIYLFGDLQIRKISYVASGLENKQYAFAFDKNYFFFNPKFGITWTSNSGTQIYSSVAIANREPVRDDLVDHNPEAAPKPERLYDFEAGLRKNIGNNRFNLNYYLMKYHDQLVPTGDLNDVGANLRVNVPDSYRMGIEVEGTFQLFKKIQWQGNLNISRNRIRKFDEVLYDYGDNFDQFNIRRITHRNTSISFSPSFIGGSQIIFQAGKGLELSFISKLVGKQYLDNTGNEDRTIDPYFLNDMRFSWSLSPRFMKSIQISLLAANIFDLAYSSNGYTYGYLGGATTYRQNYYYPQAGRNFMVMTSFRF
jgi:iron complex outermembrane receptor protein